MPVNCPGPSPLSVAQCQELDPLVEQLSSAKVQGPLSPVCRGAWGRASQGTGVRAAEPREGEPGTGLFYSGYAMRGSPLLRAL